MTWTAMRVFLLGVIGCSFTISWQTFRVQVLAVVLIGLLGLGGFSAVEAYFLAPIYASLQDNLQPNGVFKETSNSSCAPAALATVFRRWGIEATESSIARLARTSPSGSPVAYGGRPHRRHRTHRLGTSMPQLLVAARSLGIDGLELAPTWEQMQWLNRPGVLGVWLFDGVRRLPHAVAMLALSSDVVTIADPARGKIYNLNRAQFARIWRRQYVPIFRPIDTSLTCTQVAEYFYRLGYLSQPESDFRQAIRRFQESVGAWCTGKLDPQTVLLLSGSFLKGVPTLG